MTNGNTTSTQFSTNPFVFKGENYERWVGQTKVIFRFQDVAKTERDGVPALKVNANDIQ